VKKLARMPYVCPVCKATNETKKRFTKCQQCDALLEIIVSPNPGIRAVIRLRRKIKHNS